MDEPVVVDTNILFSAMLKERSRFAEVLFRSQRDFYINELILAELFKHREKIVRLSKLTEDEVLQQYYRILRRVRLFKEDLISAENRRRAFELCYDIDETDSPHVATALELNGLLWTGDENLRNGLQIKGFSRFFDP